MELRFRQKIERNYDKSFYLKIQKIQSGVTYDGYGTLLDNELFTGKTNKSGDVYVGDIVWSKPLQDKDEGYGGVVKFGEYEVEFDCCGRNYYRKAYGFYVDCIGFDEYVGIENSYTLGNIHENPELL